MMNKYFPLAVIIILSVIGCDAKQRKVHQAPPSEIATTSVEVIGGLKRWKQIGLIRATAVVTIYDETGRGTINEQHQVIDIHRNIIRASATLPHGQWSATVTADGEASVNTTHLTFTKDERKRLIRSLMIILHRVQGPLNFSMHNEKAGKPTNVIVAGKEFIRLPIIGSSNIKAYYFNPQTYVLEMVTAGADKPAGKGTVTLYRWKLLPNGLAFPSQISVVKIGSETLLGNTPVLEANYLNVQTEKKQSK